MVDILQRYRTILEERLGEATLAQLATRAGFLSDAQVLERCREELEALLRS